MVSVIIPNYNHASFLKARIDSVINQSYLDFEVIILDDHSTDSSNYIIEEYRGHPKVSNIVYNNHNSGSVFKQWEKGISLAKGQYIWIAESDDYADLGFLKEIIPLFEVNPNLGFVFCDSKIVYGDNLIDQETFGDKRAGIYNSTKWQVSYINSGLNELKENLIVKCTVNNASGVVFNKSALNTVDPFDREFKYIGDWYCYIKICKQFDVAYLNKALNYYRDHNSNASKKINTKYQYVKEYFLLYDWVINNVGLEDEAKVLGYLYDKTRHSFYRGWSFSKLHLYKQLYKINRGVFIYLLKRWLLEPLAVRGIITYT